jgi:hypothetical protein
MLPMLRPQDTATRERKALDGLWEFRLDVDGVGRAERWYAGPLADARDMAVPASYNDLVGEARRSSRCAGGGASAVTTYVHRVGDTPGEVPL